MSRLVAFLALFTSVGTLFCCALPALFVVLGAGATFAALTEAVPGLLIIGEYKGYLFASGGVFLGLGWYGSHRSTAAVCTIELDGEDACESTQQWSRPLLMLATILYLTGVGFAYILPLVV